MMSPRLRKHMPVLVTVGVVVLLAYAFYLFDSGQRTEAVLRATIRLSTPLILAAMCGLVGERTGVVNIGIEGQLLMSAFFAFYTAAAVDNIWLGILVGMIAGAAMGLFLALCAVTWKIDQIIAGTVINIFAAGLTSFLYTQGKSVDARWPGLTIPVLENIPLIGPVFFDTTRIAFAAIILAVVLHVALFHTRWGLRSRAVGELPSAADTVGVLVSRVRYVNVSVAGAFAGLGGAFLALEGTSGFERGMSANRGFTALAIMIFGRWKPLAAWAGALFFAFTTALATQLQFDDVVDIPPQFINMLPFALVIIVLAVMSGRVRPPAAAGKPYTKEG
jgi:general nucleoside transport system permease protein